MDRYRASVYAFIYAKIGNFHDAEDLTQEVFINAYQKLGTLRRWDNFYAWLYSIASNRCKNYWRSQSRQPFEYIEDQDEQTLEQPSLDAHRQERQHEAVREALSELPEIYREVLALYYLGGMNSREIAKFLGASIKTIESRLQRARAKLKEEMLTMMSATFDEMRLQPSFTFRIVEAIKRTKIQTPPSKAQLPLGVSAAAGLIVLMLSLTIPHSPLYPIGEWIGSALPSKTQVPEVGVIPVDTIEITDITILSSESGKSDFGQKPKPETPKFLGAGEWERKADMLRFRAAMPNNATVVNGKIYAIGGGKPPGVDPVATVEAYDPAADRWIKLPDMPEPSVKPTASLVDGKIYVIGGINLVDDILKVLKTVSEYDPGLNTWMQKGNMPIPLVGHGAAVVDGKIYVIGGFTVGLAPSLRGYVYQPQEDRWEQKADMPVAQAEFGAILVNGKIYAIGGWLLDPDAAVVVVQEYDPAVDTWTRKADLPVPTSNYGICAVNGKIYVIGGGSGRRGAGKFLSSVQIYDPATDTWSLGPELPEGRSNLSAAVVDGTIYVFGGQRAGVFNAKVEALDLGLSLGVSPGEKLTTTWGEIKTAHPQTPTF